MDQRGIRQRKPTRKHTLMYEDYEKFFMIALIIYLLCRIFKKEPRYPWAIRDQTHFHYSEYGEEY